MDISVYSLLMYILVVSSFFNYYNKAAWTCTTSLCVDMYFHFPSGGTAGSHGRQVSTELFQEPPRRFPTRLHHLQAPHQRVRVPTAPDPSNTWYDEFLTKRMNTQKIPFKDQVQQHLMLGQQMRCHSCASADKEAEAQRNWITFLRSLSWDKAKWGFGLRSVWFRSQIYSRNTTRRN